MFSSYGSAKKETEILESIRAMKPAGVLIAPLGDQTDQPHWNDLLSAFRPYCLTVRLKVWVTHSSGQIVRVYPETVEYLDRVGEPPVFFEMQTPANPNAVRRHEAFIEKMTELGQARIYSIPETGGNLKKSATRRQKVPKAGRTAQRQHPVQ